MIVKDHRGRQLYLRNEDVVGVRDFTSKRDIYINHKDISMIAVLTGFGEIVEQLEQGINNIKEKKSMSLSDKK